MACPTRHECAAALVQRSHGFAVCLADLDDVQAGAPELGGAVRKAETGSRWFVFASRFTKTDVGPAGEEFDREIPFRRSIPRSMSRRSTVFLDRYYGVDKTVADPVELIRTRRSLLPRTPARLFITAACRHTTPASDHSMPPFQTFPGCVKLRMSPCSAMRQRIGRRLKLRRRSRPCSRYAKDNKSERAREELIAELGSCFLCAPISASFQSWSRARTMRAPDSWLRVHRRQACHLPGGRARAARGRIPASTYCPSGGLRSVEAAEVTLNGRTGERRFSTCCSRNLHDHRIYSWLCERCRHM